MLRSTSDNLGHPLVALVLAIASVAWLSCASSPPPQSAQRPGGALPDHVRKKVCAATCTGPHAKIQVFRDTTRRIGSLRFDGDPGRCSHPPSAYFDPQGRKLTVIPFKPLVRGSAEHRRIMALHNRHTKGLKPAETVSCKP